MTLPSRFLSETRLPLCRSVLPLPGIGFPSRLLRKLVCYLIRLFGERNRCWAGCYRRLPYSFTKLDWLIVQAFTDHLLQINTDRVISIRCDNSSFLHPLPCPSLLIELPCMHKNPSITPKRYINLRAHRVFKLNFYFFNVLIAVSLDNSLNSYIDPIISYRFCALSERRDHLI
jgi:hypothetical protein